MNQPAQQLDCYVMPASLGVARTVLYVQRSQERETSLTIVQHCAEQTQQATISVPNPATSTEQLFYGGHRRAVKGVQDTSGGGKA
jgi:Tfp pilus assembly protein PilV